jgi:hypothetical protein
MIYDEITIPMAIRSKIVYYSDDDGESVSFTDRFLRFLIRPSQSKSQSQSQFQARMTVNVDNIRSLGSLALMEYFTATEVAKFLGLTYDEFFDLPTENPNKLKVIFDLGEVVHRLLNSDFYEGLAKVQEEQTKERAEWRKRVLGK